MSGLGDIDREIRRSKRRSHTKHHRANISALDRWCKRKPDDVTIKRSNHNLHWIITIPGHHFDFYPSRGKLIVDGSRYTTRIKELFTFEQVIDVIHGFRSQRKKLPKVEDTPTEGASK